MKGLVMPGFFSEEHVIESMDYKPLPDDLFVATFPKCGTTWSQHILMLIICEGKPVAEAKDFFKRTPFLEMGGLDAVVNMPRPGVIKTHFPYDYTPISPSAKYIYVARNPKDTCVSLFHHVRNFPGYQFQDGKFEDFFEVFNSGQTEWGDYCDHLLGWYKHKDDPNVLYITYESIKADHAGLVKRMATFIDPKYESMLEKDPQMLKDIVHYSSVEYMKKNCDPSFTDMFSLPPEIIESDPNIAAGVKYAIKGLRPPEGKKREFNFIRKGTVGDWKTLFTEDQSRRMEEKLKEKTKGTDIVEMFRPSGCFLYI